VLIAVAVRFLPHPWAFTPVGAALLYFGARQPRKRLWIPLALLAVSDILLTKYAYWYAFTLDTLVTWAWYAGVLLLGGLLRENARPLRLVGASLSTSVSFFLLSNFAVWAAWNMYPKTLGGLMSCYAAAVPFFRQPVADLLFVGAFFGISALVELRRREAVRA
jgi:hypothetical protein